MAYLGALALFFLIHLIPLKPATRQRFTARFGEKGYRRLFRIVIIAIVVMGVWGWSDFPNHYFYEPPLYLKQVHLMIMLPVVLLWVIAEVPNNMKRLVRHPMLYGMVLWAAGHLLANGDLRSMILFISFGGFSVWAIRVSNQRGEPVKHPRKPWRFDAMTCVLAALLYSLLVHFHGALFGMPVMPYFQTLF
ncbi:MAG: hypothetical protein C9356_18235 [Oleiphilus sp.]|nr:MAG: hypothetical protein C9356_18235 [Oleiphilus sp.]